MSTKEALRREEETDLWRYREEMLLELILQDSNDNERPNIDTESAILEWAFKSIGSMADQVDRIIERTGAMIASMSARGDRIDRVQAENRAAIDALLGISKQ